jgi:hypothetical protein
MAPLRKLLNEPDSFVDEMLGASSSLIPTGSARSAASLGQSSGWTTIRDRG